MPISAIAKNDMITRHGAVLSCFAQLKREQDDGREAFSLSFAPE
jgi:hypothetical protein